MGLFKTKIEKLTSKIAEKNLLLLDVSERNSEYELQKLYDWQEEYDWVEWVEFKDSWFYCDRCKGYSEGQCICYAR
jgi:hypothetical protein